MGVVTNEQPPRSDATVQRLAGPTATRLRRTARTFAGWFLAVGTLGGLLIVIMMGATMQTARGDSMAEGIGGAVASFLYMGALPAWVLRRMIRSDATLAERLAREGRAFAASVKSTRRIRSGMQTVQVAWEEDGTNYTAGVLVRVRAKVHEKDRVDVLSIGRRWIGVAIDDQTIHLARRRR